MKKFLLFAYVACISVWAFAVPAYRGAIKITDANGNQATIYRHGDESFHYITDEQGKWLKYDNGQYLQTQQLTDQQIENVRKRSRRNIMKARSHSVERVLPPRVLVVLAQYSDTYFQESNNKAAYNDLFNGSNYTFNGATGSVGQYFRDQSYGQYQPVFDVVGPVTLPQNQRFYGANDEYGDDRNAELMIAHACQLADTELGVDFTQYDADQDGYVDAVYVIYAGKGEADSNEENAIWPHNARVEESYDVECIVDGKHVNVYVCSSEIDNNGYREGIGTICHEFSHVMGLPDMYATEDDYGQKTLGEWDIMDYGGYNNQGRTPPAYSAYERFFMGWVEPILMNEPLNMVLRDLNESGDCGMITQNGQSNLNGLSPDPREFYLVENRQQKGWDKYIPGHGMMMTKIEFVKNKWDQNIVNCLQYNMCIDLIEADGKSPSYREDNQSNGYFGKQGDLFPAGAISWRGFSNKWTIDNISESKEIIYFDFQGGVAKCQVNFYVGSNGTCATQSATEKSKRSGVTLPAVTANSGYTFLGWSTKKNSTIADAGQAGETFYPISDCTVYALYRNDKRIDINYSLKGVEWNSGATAYAERNKAFEITFTAKQGYEIPNAKTCQVRITRGNDLMPNYSFENNMVVVRFAADEATDNVTITIKNTRHQTENGCEQYSYTFDTKCYEGYNDLGGYEWTATIRNATTLDYDKNKGAVLGSGTYPVEQFNLRTEETMGCAVAEIQVTASTASQGDAVLNAYLGGNIVGETEYLETTQQTYSFVPQKPQSGAVEIRFVNTTKAIYLKNITIKFTKLDDDTQSGLTANEDNVNIYSHNGILIVENAEIGSTIAIYNMQGQIVLQKRVSSNTEIISLNNGIYVISAGKKHIKVNI